eukprot:12615633-Alexandrium_andersonii.AAC.1
MPVSDPCTCWQSTATKAPFRAGTANEPSAEVRVPCPAGLKRGRTSPVGPPFPGGRQPGALLLRLATRGG